MKLPHTTNELLQCDPRKVAAYTVRIETEEKLRDACEVMTRAKQIYIADPIEANLRAFCLALNRADTLTRMALILSEAHGENLLKEPQS